MHEPHWNRISNRPLYSVEEDLEEYIEIKTSEGKLYNMLSVINNDDIDFKFLVEKNKDEDDVEIN